MKYTFLSVLIISSQTLAADFKVLDEEHINKVINLTSKTSYCNSLDSKTKDVNCLADPNLPSWVDKMNASDAIVFEESDSYADRKTKLQDIGCDVVGVKQDRTLIARLSTTESNKLDRKNSVQQHEKLDFRVIPWNHTHCIKNVFIIPENFDPLNQYDRVKVKDPETGKMVEKQPVLGRKVITRLPVFKKNEKFKEKDEDRDWDNTVNLFIGGYHLANEDQAVGSWIKLKDINPAGNTFGYTFEGGVPIDEFEGIRAGLANEHQFLMGAIDKNGLHHGSLLFSELVKVTDDTITFSEDKSNSIREVMDFDEDGNSEQYLIFRNTYKDGKNYDNINVTKFADVVIQNMKIDSISDYGLRAVSNKNVYIDKVEFGSLKSKDKLISADTGVHIASHRGKVNITNSIFAKSFDDHVNFYGSKSILAYYDPINKAGTKFRVCVISSDEPKVGTIYQAVAPESGRLDYIFRVARKINEESSCNLNDKKWHFPQAIGGWGDNEKYKPYWLIIEIKDLALVDSPTKDGARLKERYVPKKYSEEAALLFEADPSGNYSILNYRNDAIVKYHTDKGSNINRVQSEHYLLFDISPEVGYGKIENNIFVSAGKNAVIGKSHNMQIVNNVFVNSRKGDIGLSNYSRGQTIEGPYQFSTIVDSNVFVGEMIRETSSLNSAPPVEVISQGWSEYMTNKNAEHWDSNLRINRNNECYNLNNQNMIFHKNTKHINDVQNCRPLTW